MRVLPIHCHKRLEENTLVEGLEIIDYKNTKLDISFKNKNLDFFFDHKIDHIPAMVGISALRQACLAVGHLVYKIPMDYIVVMGKMGAEFLGYADIKTPVSMILEASNIEDRNLRIEINFKGKIFQKDNVCIDAFGELIALHPRLAKKIRR